jgi:hypothetical protein
MADDQTIQTTDIDPDHMLLLDDEEFHTALEATQIRSPNVIAGAYVMFTHGSFQHPIKPGHAAELVLKKDPIVVAYWQKHTELSSHLGFTFDATPKRFNDKALINLRNEISRACVTIQNKWLEGCELIGARYGGVTLSEEEWNLLNLNRRIKIEKIREVWRKKRPKKEKD